ncbi:SRPBCC family protein [Albidovulum sp.]|jgi:carbon monoxide dehydrogenase subunit G|uniref:SRPBCC family protein n=1 Tax=Albidovulum sp. TaxID=1872424 RepID=UPI00303C0169
MILEGDTLIPADRRTVWKALNDPEMLRDCIPGCQSLERQSDTDFTSSVRAAIGPVSATFGARITLSEIEPDRGYTISGEGKGGAAGFARGKARVDLEDEPGGTRLRYTADVNIGGKLAQVGSRLIQGTAKKLSEEFFGSLSDRLGAAPAAASDAAAGTIGRTGAPASRLLRVAGLVVVLLALAAWAVGR